GRRGVALESDKALISDQLYADASSAAQKTGVRLEPILSYLANSIRIGQREVPYSLVTGLSPDSFNALSQTEIQGAAANSGSTEAPVGGVATASPAGLAPILLNDWAAHDLGARPGDAVTLEYYIWEDQGVLSTRSAQFRLAGTVPMKDRAADPDLVPDYPGITSTQNIADWDPPFPVNLQRVRP